MNRNLLSGIAIGLFVGLLGGYFLGASHSNDDAPAVAAMAQPPAPAAPAGAPAMPKPNPLVYQDRIAANLKIVAADPRNEKAWIALGNDYFDLEQAQSSVDAYAKALAIAPNNPDVLTDQGVMYRHLGATDKAIANFQKAGKINPRHLQSFFNLGITYSQDKKDDQAAIKAWTKVIEIDPASAQAAQAKQLIAALQPKP